MVIVKDVLVVRNIHKLENSQLDLLESDLREYIDNVFIIDKIILITNFNELSIDVQEQIQDVISGYTSDFYTFDI